jgi:predicted SAM-dependent methyltransferase
MAEERKCLNIGASRSFIPDFINIDVVKHADISLDLNKDRLPFDDNTVDTIFTYHTLEHLDNYLGALAEIHRVMKHGARLFVGVPYVTSTQMNLVNPYHRQHFNEYSFDFFDPEKSLGSAGEADQIQFRKVFHRFNYMARFAGKSERRQEWARRHLFNVVNKIDFGLVAIKRKTAVGPLDAAEFQDEFDRLLASRKRYGSREEKIRAVTEKSAWRLLRRRRTP